MRIAYLALLLPSLAAASPRTTFDRATTFERCQETTMFACGMRDASGNTFGTAQIRQSCSRYTFQADGSFTSDDFHVSSRGRYRIVGGEVVVTFDQAIQPATPGQGELSTRRFSMKLSPDGDKLGAFSKIR